MQKHKKAGRGLFGFALCFIICAGASLVCLAAAPVRVFFSGDEIVYDVPPQIISDRTMVPLRLTIEEITGGAMEWDPPTKTVTFRASGHTSKHTIGQTVVYMDGQPVYFDTPSLIIDSRTLVPIRMIAETSGCEVTWEQKDRFVIITPPAEVPAASANAGVSIRSIIPNRTAAVQGESVLLTVQTNSAANYVWADCDGATVNAEYKAIDTQGNKTWSLTIFPQVSQRVTILANTTMNALNAAAEPLNISIKPNMVKIDKITASQTSINKGESVTLTIRTNVDAAYVWAEYDTSVTYAQKTNSTEDIKIWTVTVKPAETQRVQIYAGTGKSKEGATNQAQEISVTDNQVKLYNVKTDKKTIQSGSYAQLTITTNAAVEYVWAEYDRDTQYARAVQESNGTKTWTLSVSPQTSQPVFVYANSNKSSVGADSKTENITVTPGRAALENIKADRTTINSGESVAFTIRTNGEANYVWVECDGEMVYASETQSDSDSKTWSVSVSLTESQRVRVCAGAERADDRAAYETQFITVNAVSPPAQESEPENEVANEPEE